MDDPLRPKSRLPFSPTVKPSFATTGGLSGILYAVAALALGGFAVYQMKVQGFALTELRVIVAWLGAGWFAFRAVMMFTNGFTGKAGEDEKADEKGDE